MTLTTTPLTGTRSATPWPPELDAVTEDTAQGRLVATVGGTFDALRIPIRLAERVLAELRLTMLAGPVIAIPGNCWWIVLTGSMPTARPHLPAELRHAAVGSVPRGTRIILPTQTAGAAGSPCWIEPPHPQHQLPPWAAVIGTTRRVLARGEHRVAC